MTCRGGTEATVHTRSSPQEGETQGMKHYLSKVETSFKYLTLASYAWENSSHENATENYL